jgi:hypothetical protein
LWNSTFKVSEKLDRLDSEVQLEAGRIVLAAFAVVRICMYIRDGFHKKMTGTILAHVHF